MYSWDEQFIAECAEISEKSGEIAKQSSFNKSRHNFSCGTLKFRTEHQQKDDRCQMVRYVLIVNEHTQKMLRHFFGMSSTKLAYQDTQEDVKHQRRCQSWTKNTSTSDSYVVQGNTYQIGHKV